MAIPVIIIVSILAVVALALGSTAVILLFHKGNTLANRILSTLLTIFLLQMILQVLRIFSPQVASNGTGLWSGHSLILLTGPLLYLYAKAITVRGFQLRLVDLLHLFPFFILLVLSSNLIQVISTVGSTHLLNPLVPIVMMYQVLFYLIVVQRILRIHNTEIRKSFSYVDRIDFRWLRYAVVFQSLLWPITIILEFMGGLHIATDAAWMLISISMFFIGYFAIHQPDIFSDSPEYDGPSSHGKTANEEGSPLSLEEAETILLKLDDLMRWGRPYLNSELTLITVSRLLSVPPEILSQTIVDQLGVDFFSFVNYYRIDEAKRLFIDPQCRHLTTAAISLEAGFASETSFNSIFLNQMSLTPAEYRDSIQDPGSATKSVSLDNASLSGAVRYR